MCLWQEKQLARCANERLIQEYTHTTDSEEILFAMWKAQRIVLFNTLDCTFKKEEMEQEEQVGRITAIRLDTLNHRRNLSMNFETIENYVKKLALVDKMRFVTKDNKEWVKTAKGLWIEFGNPSNIKTDFDLARHYIGLI